MRYQERFRFWWKDNSVNLTPEACEELNNIFEEMINELENVSKSTKEAK